MFLDNATIKQLLLNRVDLSSLGECQLTPLKEYFSNNKLSQQHSVSARQYVNILQPSGLPSGGIFKWRENHPAFSIHGIQGVY